MKGWIRRIRGAIGIGLTWAFAWFAAGMVLLLIIGPDAADVPFPLGFGALGFLAGMTFSGVLRLVEGRRRFDQMSIPRFALWGGVGAAAFAGLFVGITDVGTSALTFLAPIFGISGAVCAAGTLALARMAEDSELLEAGEDVSEVGLTAEERRELLG